ncbi:MAG: T9SS type A sorting domain-containing protein [Sphingobacteriales bacterium]|nr:T9SS type A sorting domain-containing protein [Sphingobacteriales bacterium]
MKRQFRITLNPQSEGVKKSGHISKGMFLLLVATISLYSNAQFNCSGLTTTNISYTGGVQTVTIPASGISSVRISITGASGGQATASSNLAGGGATVYAYVNVVPGDVFRVIIGQKGMNGGSESGGGGSSAIYKNGVLIMVAGGGGGEDNTGNGGNGLASTDGGNGGSDVSTGSTGGCGSSPNNGKGGTGGNGGNHGEFSANCVHGGGGGGGLNSAGQGNGNINSGQPGGQGNINGANGGAGSLDDASGINGGWGWSGGGGADSKESGGGGGYSGGGGGPESKNPGGGGSFVAAIGTNGITASGKSDGTGTSTGSDGSGMICSPVLLTLPVIFESFTVDETSQGNLLKWVISSEINTSHYEIEKSIDGINFTKIDILSAAGTDGGAREYRFTDISFNQPKIFYRIKSVDIDAKYVYSVIRYVNRMQQVYSLAAYPNPAKGKLSIVLPQSWQGSNIRILLINAMGQVIMEKNVSSQQNDFNVEMLPRGVYLIKAFSDKKGEQLTGRFIK